IFDDRIVKIETHTYNPYANTTFGHSDEIRIPIEQQDLYTLSFIEKGPFAVIDCSRQNESVKSAIVDVRCPTYRGLYRRSTAESVDEVWFKRATIFLACIHKLSDRWEKCIANDGQYFE
ncbi:hypothetical protein ALC57_13281, partial [Trachymyrmex cornetzi]